MNCNYFQLVMLAYNLNCWLMLFNRAENAKVDTLQHTTLATARLRSSVIVAAAPLLSVPRLHVTVPVVPGAGARQVPSVVLPLTKTAPSGSASVERAWGLARRYSH
jgi:hypothetical protein